jgi:hypothetical protein
MYVQAVLPSNFNPFSVPPTRPHCTTTGGGLPLPPSEFSLRSNIGSRPLVAPFQTVTSSVSELARPLVAPVREVTSRVSRKGVLRAVEVASWLAAPLGLAAFLMVT